jgi:hypothetical protein
MRELQRQNADIEREIAERKSASGTFGTHPVGSPFQRRSA